MAGYGRRPLWQWIVIYVIIAIIVYGIIYYLFFAHKGYSGSSSEQNEYSTPSPPVSKAPGY